MTGTKFTWMNRNRQALRSAAVGVFLLSIAVSQSWAWGREGHRLTALVAEQYLTPEARAQVEKLLGKETLADVAPWADIYRESHPETARWHFVDIPKSAATFDRQRDCPLSATDPKSPWRDCVTDRILYFEGRLGDASLSTEERAFALKFLVHLIGDIHQPFHAFGDDKGGNTIFVTLSGSSYCGLNQCSLHRVWDDMIIDEQGLSEKKYTERLLQEIKDNQWERLAGGEPTTWANISHQYALQALAPNGAILTREYIAAEAKVVDAQLALGGLRLARVLNRILGTEESPAASQMQPAQTSQPKGAVNGAQPAPTTGTPK